MGARAGFALTTGRSIRSELVDTLPESPATQAQLYKGPGAQSRVATEEAAFSPAVSKEVTGDLVRPALPPAEAGPRPVWKPSLFPSQMQGEGMG